MSKDTGTSNKVRRPPLFLRKSDLPKCCSHLVPQNVPGEHEIPVLLQVAIQVGANSFLRLLLRRMHILGAR